MSKDTKTISNEYHELEAVAKKFNIPVSKVMYAKEQTKSNDRKVVEEYILKEVKK